jgi:ribosomal protein L11 methylase PrmA
MIKELSSFRDPEASLMYDETHYYRSLSTSYQVHYNRFITSGLKNALLLQELILPFDELQGEDELILKTKKIAFVSYPYEWSFSQFKAAALLTLKINLISLEHGMVLKDASMFNVQFVGSKPVFIDLASFEVYKADKPWIAYYQFCKHFYAPLFLAAQKNLHLPKLLLYFIDGIPLKEAVSLCKLSDFFNIGALMHLYLHSKSEGSENKTGVEKKVAKKQLTELIMHLSDSIKSLKPKQKKTLWDDYNQNNNYLEESKDHKTEIIKGFIKQIPYCKIAMDIGANDGNYSKVFCEKEIYTLVVDIDELAIERAFIENNKLGNMYLHPLHVNLANPTPAIGWNNVERKAFWERCQMDVIQALAVVHHLSITHDISFKAIAEKLSKHTDYLIIEFVHPDDSQAQILLKNKPHHNINYNQDNFEKAFSLFFNLKEKVAITGMKRDLYFYERAVNLKSFLK